MLQDQLESLKIKLISVTKTKLRKEREEYALRNTEQILSEELRKTKAETELMSLQLEDIKSEISKIQRQVAVIGICEVSEKSKIENQISNLAHHKNGFEQIFFKEKEILENHNMEIKRKEAEEKELERQRWKIKQEKTQEQIKEAAAIDIQCDAIEQECVVLKKRNKAILLKLRRKLIESEELRRNLIKKH